MELNIKINIHNQISFIQNNNNPHFKEISDFYLHSKVIPFKFKYVNLFMIISNDTFPIYLITYSFLINNGLILVDVNSTSNNPILYLPTIVFTQFDKYSILHKKIINDSVQLQMISFFDSYFNNYHPYQIIKLFDLLFLHYNFYLFINYEIHNKTLNLHKIVIKEKLNSKLQEFSNQPIELHYLLLELLYQISIIETPKDILIFFNNSYQLINQILPLIIIKPNNKIIDLFEIDYHQNYHDYSDLYPYLISIIIIFMVYKYKHLIL